MLKVSKILALVVFLFTLIFTIKAYFIVSISPESGQIFDGLGRQLTPTPTWLRILLVDKQYWAGFLWHSLDTMISISGFYISYLLFKKYDL